MCRNTASNSGGERRGLSCQNDPKCMIPGGSSVGNKSPVISGISRINPLITRVKKPTYDSWDDPASRDHEEHHWPLAF